MAQELQAQSDRELVDRAKNGDRGAFGELFRRYGPRVHRLARQLVRGHADADDVAQEAFVRAHQALPRFDGRSEFFTWIYRIAVNLTLNRARANNVRKNVDVDDPGLEGALIDKSTKDDDPSRGVDKKRLAEALMSEMDALPEALVATMTLVLIEGLPQEQVATILGCKVGTVAWRVHEGRKRLWERLRARGLDDALDDVVGERAKKGGR